MAQFKAWQIYGEPPPNKFRSKYRNNIGGSAMEELVRAVWRGVSRGWDAKCLPIRVV